MEKSKPWKWEMVNVDEEYWNKPSSEIYYLKEIWKEKSFKNFLDIGCGFGRNSIYMAKNGFDVSAFDLSEYGVKITREKANEQQVKINDLCVADMLEMPYQDESFDCIIALNVISHTDKLGFEKTLKEIRRVLKPGGEVYFTVGSKESFWWKHPSGIPVDEYTKIRVEDGPENGIPHFYINDEDCLKLFNDFKIIQIKNIRELTQYGNFSSHYHVWLKK